MPARHLMTTTFAVLVFSIGGAVGASAQPTLSPTAPAEAVDATPPIEFYLAKGEANACGLGCSQWIAAEGRINAGAAQRLRGLLAKVGRERPPIFFHSPGGLLFEGLEVGRLIREQKLVTSVGHTVPVACAGDKTSDKSCEARQQSGQAVESTLDSHIDLTLRGDPRVCNSSCVYALLGGVIRVIPPGVKLGIHDVRLDPAHAQQPKAVFAQSQRLAHERIQEFLHEMGIDEALYRAALATPFEFLRPLERDELVRFAIDRREFDETAWEFADQPEPSVGQRFFARTDNDRTRYLEGLVALQCGMASDIRLIFGRHHGAAVDAADAANSTISVSISGQRIDLKYITLSPDYDERSASLPEAMIDLLAGSGATLRLSGTDLARTDDAKGLSLDMHGFSDALAKLRRSCALWARK